MQKQTIASQLVRLKRKARDLVRERKILYSELSRLKEQLEEEERKVFKNQYTIAKLRGAIDSLDTILDIYRYDSAILGEYAIHLLDEYEACGATDHDLAQVLNCSIKDMERYRRDYEESDGKRHGFFLSAVFVYLAEYRPRKGDGGIAPPGSTPLCDAIFDRIMLEYDRNRKLRERMRDKIEEIFPEIRGMQYVLAEGPDGEKRLEKYYPPLKLVKPARQ